jgi:hypothetical protein
MGVHRIATKRSWYWQDQANSQRNRPGRKIVPVTRHEPRWDDTDEYRLWAQRVHAARRAAERYGVKLDARALRVMSIGMSDTLTKPGLLYLGRCDDGRRTAYWLVVVDRVEMLAAFDETTRQVATFLPANANQLRFAGGRFVSLVNGGSRQGRDYWIAR